MNTRKTALVLLIVLLAASAAYFIHQREENSSSQQIITIYGNIDIRQVQLAFFNTGRIESLLVDEGAVVEPGQLLARLDDSRFKAAVAQLKGEVAAQEQIVAKLHAGSRPQEILAAKARVAKAEAAVKDARISFQRLERLSRTQFVSRQKLDDARARLDMAKAELQEAKQYYSLALEGPRKEDVEAAEAKLASLRGALALAREKLEDTKLYAPAHGIVRDRILQVGDMAFPQRPVFTLALFKPLWVRAYIPETDLGKISIGMEAEVTVDSFPDRRFDGWIGYISPTAEFTPRNVETPDLRTRLVYQVRVYVCNPENRLRLGMPATVHIDTTQTRKQGPFDPSRICEDRQEDGA